MATLPNGLQRGDGSNGRIGTITPSGSIVVSSASGNTIATIPIEELPDSPELERAEQATITHRFSMSWDEAVNRIQFLGRGTVLYDETNGINSKILSTNIKHQKPGTAIMTIVAEAISFDPPMDQFSITPVELGLNIIKHPRYYYAFLGEGQGSTTELVNQAVINLLQSYFDNTTAAYRDAIIKILNDSIGTQGSVGDAPPTWTGSGWKGSTVVSGTDLAKRAALEIVQKFWRGEETPYIIGYQISWSSFYFRPQYLNPGGYVEDPLTATPQLPEYFWGQVGAGLGEASTTIWDKMAQFNPQCYSNTGTEFGNESISWLRRADEMEYERTWFKLTRTWFGSPVGFWDAELYTQGARPSQDSDYLEINAPT